MHYEATVAMAGSVVLLIVTFLSLQFGLWDSGPGCCMLLYGLAELLTSFSLLFTRVLRNTTSASIQRPFLREMNKQSFVFGLCSACTLVYFYLDTVMLSKMASIEIVSCYTAAYNVVFALILLPQVLVDTLFPLLSRHFLGEGRPIGSVVSNY